MNLARVILGCALLTFFGGCRDEGGVSTMSQARQITERVAGHHLPLTGLLAVPGQHNEFDELRGEVVYHFIVLVVDPIPPIPQTRTFIEFSVNANLRPWGFATPVWEFSGSSTIEVRLQHYEPLFLTTRYPVPGTELWFALTLKVTGNAVEVRRTMLVLPRTKAAIGTE